MGLAGVLAFGLLVLTLHLLQPAYDARHQLLSELAEGRGGWALRLAFGGVVLALLGVQHGLGAVGAAAAPRALLGGAAVALGVAGAVPLGQAAEVHIVAVLMGLVLIGVAGYLLPTRAGRLPARALRRGTWLLGCVAVAGLVSMNFGMPIGLAQRLAVACVLGWLGWLSVRLLRAGPC